MNNTESIVSSKNQVVIPAWVRKSLKIGPKTKLNWIQLSPNQVTLVVKKEKNLADLRGILRKYGSTEGLVDEFIADKQKEIFLEDKTL
jgi:bifunctional DNA-binding transcriptional regulator/antitoxin component of YhaV-PrlF toxin-antitoxin module